jgi:uncharacterized protein with NRDE domain
MCLILIGWQSHPDFPLVIAANRDEFLRRPTARAAFWADAPDLVAGRDLEAGGTWLGVSRTGRVALLTNHRDPRSHLEGAPSRGALVAEFLKGEENPGDFLRRKEGEATLYNGFHLVVGDLSELWYFTNTGGRPQRLSPGIHGISNGPVDEPWPKVTRSTRRLSRLLEGSSAPNPAALLDLLSDRERAADAELPSTGVPLEWERLLSSVFVEGETYGTRSSTALLVFEDGGVRVVERTFEDGRPVPPDPDAAIATLDAKLKAAGVDKIRQVLQPQIDAYMKRF